MLQMHTVTHVELSLFLTTGQILPGTGSFCNMPRRRHFSFLSIISSLRDAADATRLIRKVTYWFWTSLWWRQVCPVACLPTKKLLRTKDDRSFRRTTVKNLVLGRVLPVARRYLGGDRTASGKHFGDFLWRRHVTFPSLVLPAYVGVWTSVAARSLHYGVIKAVLADGRARDCMESWNQSGSYISSGSHSPLQEAKGRLHGILASDLTVQI